MIYILYTFPAVAQSGGSGGGGGGSNSTSGYEQDLEALKEFLTDIKILLYVLLGALAMVGFVFLAISAYFGSVNLPWFNGIIMALLFAWLSTAIIQWAVDPQTSARSGFTLAPIPGMDLTGWPVNSGPPPVGGGQPR